MSRKAYRTLGVSAFAVIMICAGGLTMAHADGFLFGIGGLHRLVADYQNSTSLGSSPPLPGCGGGEICTSQTPGPNGTGGTVVYTQHVTIPDNTVFITFSGQGDAHGGSALLMTASVTDAAGNETFCQPLAGQTDIGGGGTHLQTGWYTLLHLPDAGTNNVSNCSDGGGGAADCHDNNIYFSCCAQVQPDSAASEEEDHHSGKRKTFGTTPTQHTINIKLANSDGNLSFYERSTIYVDSASGGRSHSLCAAHGAP